MANTLKVGTLVQHKEHKRKGVIRNDLCGLCGPGEVMVLFDEARGVSRAKVSALEVVLPANSSSAVT